MKKNELDFSVEISNLNTFEVFSSSNIYGIPDLLLNEDLTLPDNLIEYRSPLSKKGKDCLHYFLQDYRFTSVWNYPTKTFPRIKACGMTLTPDFSPYSDYPTALQVFNVYRNRWCGRFWQNHGIEVIPTVTWNDKEENDNFCFAGIPEGSIVAISLVGNLKEYDRGMEQLLKRIRPSKILVYGEAFSKVNLPDNSIKFLSRWAKKKEERKRRKRKMLKRFKFARCYKNSSGSSSEGAAKVNGKGGSNKSSKDFTGEDIKNIISTSIANGTLNLNARKMLTVWEKGDKLRVYIKDTSGNSAGFVTKNLSDVGKSYSYDNLNGVYKGWGYTGTYTKGMSLEAGKKNRDRAKKIIDLITKNDK